MKKKNPEMLSAESLVSMAKASHQKVMDEAAQAERAHKKRIADLTEKERGLKQEIATGRETLEKMIEDFEVLEEKKKAAIEAAFDSSRLSEADVKSGKITIGQFQAEGKRAEEIEKTVAARTLEALEQSSSAVRSKGEEIARLQLALYSTQSSIHGLLTQPVKSLRMSYRNLIDMLDYQMEGLTKDGHSSQSLKVQKEHEIQLIEKGIAVSGGYVWSNIGLKEAYRIRLDPILPEEHIPLLLKGLSEIEETEGLRITVTYHPPGGHWPGDPVEIRTD